MTKDQMISLLRLFADEMEKMKFPAAAELTPPITPRVYVVKRGQRGRCPTWVLKQTGLATKQAVLREYGDGFKIVEVLS